MLFRYGSCGGGLSAQSQAVGSWKNRMGQAGSLTAYTDSALGIGTPNPEGKAELRYCPPPQLDHMGFLITKVQCTPVPPPPGGIPGGEATGTPSVAAVPPHTFTGSMPIGFPWNSLSSDGQPLFWARMQTPASPVDPGRNDACMIIHPNGRTGLNVLNPRAALDVRGAGINTPAAIFGSNAQRVSVNVPGTPLPMRYTRHVEVVPLLAQNGYNNISREKDLGILFTDGLSQEGSNLDGALVIAPWSMDSTVGGLRMEANGNTELRGNLRCTKLTVNAKWWPDGVFADEYHLMPLSEVANFIKANRHLPGIPSEKAVLENGQDVGVLQVLQQQKIEELTLYVLEQEQKSVAQQQLILEQKKRLEQQEIRLQKLESVLGRN